MTRTIKILFTLSVLLNVLLLGAAGGYAIKRMQAQSQKPWDHIKNDLSPESQKMVTEGFQKIRTDMEPLMNEVRKTREEMKSILMEDRFDVRKYNEAALRAQGLRREMSEKFMGSTQKIVAGLTPEERKKVAAHFVGQDWKRKRNPIWSCPDARPFDMRVFFGPAYPPQMQAAQAGAPE